MLKDIALIYKNPFLNNCIDESQYGDFQQDGMTTNTAGDTLRFLQENHDYRILIQRLWPQQPPDLTAPGFLVWSFEE